jgi:ornithine cyclodeaminase/alanine dehydrogenase
MKEILILSRNELEQLLSLEDIIPAVEKVFSLHAQGKAKLADSVQIDVEEPKGEFHIKSGQLVLEKPYVCLKMNGAFFDNPERYGLPSICGLILLYSGLHGRPLAVMESGYITILRTGAAGAVAAKYLARKDAKNAAVFGCGTQGKIQLKALHSIMPMKTVFAFDQDQQKKETYAGEMSDELGIKVIAVKEPQEAAEKADIIITCTPAKQAIIKDSWVKEGTFICGIGADSPGKQEMEPAIFKRAKVVVDSLNQCKIAGEIQHALKEGILKESDIYAELGEIISGLKPAREMDSEIIVFDSTGLAAQDAISAAIAYEKATSQNKGLRYKVFK